MSIPLASSLLRRSPRTSEQFSVSRRHHSGSARRTSAVISGAASRRRRPSGCTQFRVTNAVPSEANLRDQLVARLDLIEYGPHDPTTEYHLPNDHGTTGCVDILARDRHGHRVIIEVKRSRKATREALHEVGKYMELLSRVEGYTADRIRAIIVSTVWDELSAPFDEAVRRSEQRLDGYLLICD
jgi:Endonuclease NucS